MRLIDADALLENLIKTPRYFDLKFDIDNAPTIEPKTGEWIPCSERLPEEGTTVLTYDGEVNFGEYENGVWYWLAEACADYWAENGGVIAWMPLPKPYREEGEA